MARPWVLLVLLMLIVFTSQFEWNANHIQHTTTLSTNQHFPSNHQDSVKDKIILSQEKNIQRLNELVRSLREQLQHCKSENYVVNNTVIPLTEHLNELEQQSVMED